MATLVSALATEFTPSAGEFIIQVTGGVAQLMRKNSSGAEFAAISDQLQGGYTVSNPVAGAVYKFSAFSGSPIVQADQ